MSRVEERVRPPSIDPRIRARRIEVQRHAGRRRLRRLLDLGLIVMVAAGFLAALRSPLLDVDEVRVAGAGHTGARAVIEASGIAPGKQLVDVELGAAGRRIAELPWVGEVHLRRGLDGVVEITVSEREPAAVVGQGPSAVVVDGEGRVLSTVEDEPGLAGKLVRIAGQAGSLRPGEEVGARSRPAITLAARLGSVVPGAVSEVVPGRELVARLAQGGEARFGDADRLGAKLRSLQAVLEHVDLTCLDKLDLRAPGSPVLTRREGCS